MLSFEHEQLPKDCCKGISRPSFRSSSNTSRVTLQVQTIVRKAGDASIEFLFMKDLCSRYPKDEEGRFQARAAVARGLQKFRPDSNDQKVEEWLK